MDLVVLDQEDEERLLEDVVGVFRRQPMTAQIEARLALETTDGGVVERTLDPGSL